MSKRIRSWEVASNQRREGWSEDEQVEFDDKADPYILRAPRPSRAYPLDARNEDLVIPIQSSSTEGSIQSQTVSQTSIVDVSSVLPYFTVHEQNNENKIDEDLEKTKEDEECEDEYQQKLSSLIEYYESQPLKTKFSNKRSQLTRKRSKSLTSLNLLYQTNEEAKFQGDSIERDHLNQFQMTNGDHKKKETSKENENKDVSNLLFKLLDIYNPKVPQVEPVWNVYTVDKIQYDIKVTPTMPEVGKKFLSSRERDHIPKCVLLDGEELSQNMTLSDEKVEDVLNFIRTTAVTFAARNSLGRATSDTSFGSNTESSLTAIPWRLPVINEATELSRNQSSVSEFDKQAFWTNTQPTTSSFNNFQENESVTHVEDFHQSKRSTVRFNRSIIKMESERSSRFGRTPEQMNSIVDTNNNNNNRATRLPVSSSSSEESLPVSTQSVINRDSFRQYQAYATSSYSSRVRPSGPATPSILSKASTHVASTSCGNDSVRDSSDDERRFKSNVASYQASTIQTTEGQIELAKKNMLIEEATYGLTVLLDDLQTLWLSVTKTGSISTISNFSGEKNELLRQVGLCSFVVKEMESDWRSFAAFYPDPTKLETLSQANHQLRERLEQAKVTQSNLQAEIGYLFKEKAIMTTEIKELSMQLACRQTQVKLETPTTIAHNRSTSNCSTGFHVTMDPETGSNFVKKREADFNSLMEFVKVRGSDMNYYHTQLDQYDTEVIALQRQIEVTTTKQKELEKVYFGLVEENKFIARERQHYEYVLKLILQEKQSDGSSLHDLLQMLISKLNTMSDEGIDSNSRGSLIEGALQAVQEQNSNYRDEITNLKDTLSKVSPKCLAGKCEQETTLEKVSVETYSKLLAEKNEEMKQIQKIQEEKYNQLQEIYDLVSKSKAKLDKAFTEKEVEQKKAKEALHTLQKTSLKQQKKIHELQRMNTRLVRDIQQYKHNIDSLNALVLQLRSSLNDKNTQYSEKIRVSGEEIMELKEQYRWFQIQIEQLTQQLNDAQERMKGHEYDKSCLAQQVMSAEEERKVVDRKLDELRAALQGDSVMREALMERNEILQTEISRLRRAKYMSLEIKGLDDLEFDPPPSEMSTPDVLCSFNTLPPSAIDDKHGTKKNRYTTVGFEEPRVVASMHSTSERGK